MNKPTTTAQIDAELLSQLTLATLFYTTALTLEMDANELSEDEFAVIANRYDRYSAAYDKAEKLRHAAIEAAGIGSNIRSA